MKPKIDPNPAALASIGIDIGKEILHVVGLGTDGKITFRRKIKRLALKEAFEKLPPCIVGMEACLSAHFVSRMLKALGHEPRIKATARVPINRPDTYQRLPPAHPLLRNAAGPYIRVKSGVSSALGLACSRTRLGPLT